MSEPTKREEAAVENETARPIQDAEAEKIVGGCGQDFWRHQIVLNSGSGNSTDSTDSTDSTN